MKRIAPSILSADFGRLREEIQAVEAAGADYLHIDVMDGHFVPNITFGPTMVEAIRKISCLPLDVHLMIQNPDQFIPAFAQAGADILAVHLEVSSHLNRTVNLIRESSIDSGGSPESFHLPSSSGPNPGGRGHGDDHERQPGFRRTEIHSSAAFRRSET